MNRFHIIILLIGFSTGVFAQAPRLAGGAGFFRFGYANLNRVGQTLDQFTPASGIGNDFVYVGGEGYARLNKYIFGGGGYGAARRSVSRPTYHAEPFSGGGYLYGGWIIIDTRRFWVYPTVGVGVALVGLTQTQQLGQTIKESSVMLPNINAQFGIGADWLVAALGEGEGYGGLLMGIRAGYQLSPSSSGWRSTGELSVPDRPRYATNGYFVTMTLGVGGFFRQYPRSIVH